MGVTKYPRTQGSKELFWFLLEVLVHGSLVPFVGLGGQMTSPDKMRSEALYLKAAQKQGGDNEKGQ